MNITPIKTFTTWLQKHTGIAINALFTNITAYQANLPSFFLQIKFLPLGITYSLTFLKF